MHLGQLKSQRACRGKHHRVPKAEVLIGSDNPVLQNWMARALLDLNRPQDAVDSLGLAAEFYPGYYLSFLHLGEANIILGNPREALPHLLDAASINPFDPEVHRQLSRAYDAPTTEEADRARHHMTIVNQ